MLSGCVDGLPIPPDPAEWRPPPWRVRLLILGLAAIAFAVVGLTGGLDRVPPPAPAAVATVPVNQNVDAGPWRAMVTNAAATTELGSYKPTGKGNWLLAVAVQIDLTEYSRDSLRAGFIAEAVTLRGIDGLVDQKPREILLIRDASRLEYLNPGLPERLAFVFEVAGSIPVPKQVVVVLHGRDPYWSWTERRYIWPDPVTKAEVTVDLANRMATT